MSSRKRNPRAGSPDRAAADSARNPLVSFSVYQFARRHGVTPPTIYGEIYRGHLPAMRIGRGNNLRITSDHEAEWMRRRAFSSAAPT